MREFAVTQFTLVPENDICILNLMKMFYIVQFRDEKWSEQNALLHFLDFVLDQIDKQKAMLLKRRLIIFVVD